MPGTNKCISNIRAIHAFLDAVDNNWRNAAYVECKVCEHDKSNGCENFLFAVNSSGTPVFLPEKDAETIFGQIIDRSECIIEISNTRLLNLYRPWFHAHARDAFSCPLLQQVLSPV